MATYRLECVLRHEDGRPDIDIENHAIEARTPLDAIALADLHGCTKPLMIIVSAKLFGPSGQAIWSRRSATLLWNGRASDLD